MSTLLSSRVQSAHHRSSSNVHAAHVQQRPISSMGVHRSRSDAFELPPWRTPSSSSTPPGRRSHFQRPKTAVISSSTRTRFSEAELEPEEIDTLLRSADRDDGFVVQVDCLADYRKLVETINLRYTPADCKSLYALQKRENRIIQHNACRDRRFRSLLKALEPAHVFKMKDNHTDQVKHRNSFGYQANAKRFDHDGGKAEL